jgi:Mn2+/Fe2+ NRAMP family transporter
MSYARYAAVLKWATPCLFAYVAVVFAAHVPWGTALAGTFIPQLIFDKPHAMAMVAVLGTTISPYLFFWQAGQEVEELRRRHVKALCTTPREAGPELSRIRTDTIVGMGVSNLIALCIIFATAATLNANGVTDIQTSAQARRRCGLLRASSPSRCSRPASWQPVCWRCRCSPGPPHTG